MENVYLEPSVAIVVAIVLVFNLLNGFYCYSVGKNVALKEKSQQEKTDECRVEIRNNDAVGKNICEHCDEKPHKFTFDVADTGRCSVCGEIAECWDHDLIGMYYSMGLTDDQIYSHLPRLRNSGVAGSNEVSLTAIGERIAKNVELMKIHDGSV
ncbi:hypothetical protein CAG54_11085 [Vibrio sp. V27_P1S3P104]|uniref:hypothetical protein n=1 Tax=unclassified Vibrio TaxID=2614977 RepID=UPI0013725B64|nr:MULTISPECIES: hypothetical protein [unclassified Vibrio]NAX35482.1 hypothetical protein [Vibrio sp. V29_P1S30P107]NAX38040.1 hypothetical protein [Vibrio sp. V27_P1S3P104]